MWPGEVDIPTLERSTRDDWLQSSPVIPIALSTSSAISSYILLPARPVKAPPDLFLRFIFSEVSSSHTGVTLSDGIRYIFTRK